MVSRYKNWKHFLISTWEVIKNRYPAKNLVVIGVTGTDGKTTTAHLIYEILREGEKSVGLVSTVGAFMGDVEVDTGFHVTTPDARLLQPLLWQMARGGVKYVVLEITSHGLDQHRVLGCNFWAGAMTNVTHEHLDYHGNFENYRKAKLKLFRGVKVAVLNKDDPSFDYFKGGVGKAKVVSYSIGGKARLSAFGIKLKEEGMEFEVKEGGRVFRVMSRLVGDYNVSNILAAIGVGRGLGLDWETIKKAIERFKGVKGRMDLVDCGQPFMVVIDFAHTPNALEKCLEILRKSMKKGVLICVFGCAGERDVLKRPMMGGVAARLADISIFTAEDPRHEDVNEIIESMAEGAREAGGREVVRREVGRGGRHAFVREPDRKEAIRLAVDLVGRGDVVVICGKGHERSMAYGDEERPWSDEIVVRKMLKARFKN